MFQMSTVEIDFPLTAMNKTRLAKIGLFACLCLLANIDRCKLSSSCFLSLSYDFIRNIASHDDVFMTRMPRKVPLNY